MAEKKFDIAGDVKEVLIREGAAQVIRDPLRLQYNGVLKAPFQFLEQKISGTHVAVMGANVDLALQETETIYNTRRSTLLVDTDEGKLTLMLNDKDNFNDIIIGTLTESDDYADFCINDDDRFFGLNEVIKMVKRNKFKFADAAQHTQFLTNLMNFNARITTVVQQHKDDKTGNSLNLLQRVVEENKSAPEFKLNCPIYKGYPKKIFNVQTCIDASSGSIRFFFESVDLYELLDSEKEKAILEELTLFKENFNCSVVRVS